MRRPHWAQPLRLENECDALVVLAKIGWEELSSLPLILLRTSLATTVGGQQTDEELAVECKPKQEDFSCETVKFSICRTSLKIADVLCFTTA